MLVKTLKCETFWYATYKKDTCLMLLYLRSLWQIIREIQNHTYRCMHGQMLITYINVCCVCMWTLEMILKQWKGCVNPSSSRKRKEKKRANSYHTLHSTNNLQCNFIHTLSTLFPTSILMQSWFVEYKSISFAHISDRFVNVSRRVTSYTVLFPKTTALSKRSEIRTTETKATICPIQQFVDSSFTTISKLFIISPQVNVMNRSNYIERISTIHYSRVKYQLFPDKLQRTFKGWARKQDKTQGRDKQDENTYP